MDRPILDLLTITWRKTMDAAPEWAHKRYGKAFEKLHK